MQADGHEKSRVALSDQVRGKISELIHNRTLVGGDVIIEQRLAEKLGVSRTPLREALQRLEGEGMVQKSSGRSYLVRKVEFQEYLQSFKVRLLLEPEAAAATALRAPEAKVQAIRMEIAMLRSLPDQHTEAHWRSDDNLHRMVGMYCGNAVLFDMIEKLRVTTRLYEIQDLRQQVSKDLEQHGAIIEAIAAGDGAAARKAMQAHLRSLINHSLRQVA